MAQSEEESYELPESFTESGLKITEDTDGARNDAGYVYCIAEYNHGKRTGMFKVGTAADPDKRLRDLQTGNANNLKFLGQPQYAPYRLDTERAAHTALRDYAVNYGGGTEWFKASPTQEQAFYNTYRQAVKK